MHALTIFELRDYRRHLEAAIAFFDQQDPVPPARATLRAALDKVIAGAGTILGNRNDHRSRVTKRWIKIRNEKGANRT
jgi:hypothetical protein